MADEAQLDAIARANAFAVYNGITTHQTGDGTAEAILEIGPDSLNPYGLLHGGAYYTLADCAAGSACRTDGRKYVTLHGSLDFIRSARAGQVTARARWSTVAAPPAWYPSPWTTERVRYMPAVASPFSAPHPLSRGATARTANAVRAVSFLLLPPPSGH